MLGRRKLTAALLVVAIGLPGVLGTGLHWLQPHSCNHELASHHSHSCGHDHHHHHGHHHDHFHLDAPTDPGDGLVEAPHDCAICAFLALAQDKAEIFQPATGLELLSESPCRCTSQLAPAAVPLEVLARGPPALILA